MSRTITIYQQDGYWSVLDTGTCTLTIGLCVDEALGTVARMLTNGDKPNFGGIPIHHNAYDDHIKKIKKAAALDARDKCIEDMKRQFMLLPHQLTEGPKE